MSVLFAIGGLLTLLLVLLCAWILVLAPVSALLWPQPVERGPLGTKMRSEDGRLGSTRALGHTVLDLYSIFLIVAGVSLLFAGGLLAIVTFLTAL